MNSKLKYITIFIFLISNSFSMAKEDLFNKGISNCKNFIEDHIKEAWVRSSPDENGKEIKIAANDEDVVNFRSNDTCSECGNYLVKKNNSIYSNVISVEKFNNVYHLKRSSGKSNLINEARDYGYGEDGVDEKTTISTININGKCYPREISHFYKWSGMNNIYDIVNCAKLSVVPNSLKEKVKKCSEDIEQLSNVVGSQREIDVLSLVYNCNQFEKKYKIDEVYDHILKQLSTESKETTGPASKANSK